MDFNLYEKYCEKQHTQYQTLYLSPIRVITMIGILLKYKWIINSKSAVIYIYILYAYTLC